MQNIIKYSLIIIFAIYVSACSDTTASSDNNGLDKVSNYQGSWYQNGTSGTQKAIKSIIINSDLSYIQTVNEFASTAKLELNSVRIGNSEITAIETDEDNPEYEIIFISITDIQITPKTAVQASRWNIDEYGGLTDWTTDVTKTFNSENPGYWQFGSIWLDHVAVSVKREGDLLNVNERGGFDGFDPPEDIYFLD